MKFFVFIMLGVLLFPFVGMANDLPLPEVLRPAPEAKSYDTREALLEKHYADCPADQYGLFAEENNALLCSCLVAQTDALLVSDADLRRYVLRERGWIPLKDKVLFQAYPECVAKALNRVTHDECMGSFEEQSNLQAGKSVCACVGDGFEEFLLERSSDFTQYYLGKAPRGTQPFLEFLSGYGMEVQNKYLLRTCIERYEYGWE